MKMQHKKSLKEDQFCSKIKNASFSIGIFATTLLVYSLFYVPMEEQSLFGMILKFLPILALQLFVYQHGLKSKYGYKILIGLILASIGDAFLDFPGYFIHGTVFFLFAQIFNISAFGFQPLNVEIGFGVFALMSTPIFFIYEKLLLESFPMSLILPIYALLLKTMVWRSISGTPLSSCCSQSDKKDCKNMAVTCRALGGISFGISDAALALNKYWRPIPYAQPIIMSTYYLAQFGIALSVLNFTKNKKSK